MLLSPIGTKSYELLRNLLAPTLMQVNSFDKLVQSLMCLFEAEPVIITKHYRFHCRNETAGASVAEFLAELKCLATHCQFGTFLDEGLCDELVCGLHSKSVQKQLLDKTDLTLKKAMELAQCMEAADRHFQVPKKSRSGSSRSSCSLHNVGPQPNLQVAPAKLPLWPMKS